MKILKTVIAAVAVFAMTIGSGFAMDNNPPAEPVKGIVETEADAPMQTPYVGPVCYDDAFGNKVIILNPPSMHCTVTITDERCTIEIDGILKPLYSAFYDNTTNTWLCLLPLYKIPNPF